VETLTLLKMITFGNETLALLVEDENSRCIENPLLKKALICINETLR